MCFSAAGRIGPLYFSAADGAFGRAFYEAVCAGNLAPAGLLAASAPRYRVPCLPLVEEDERLEAEHAAAVAPAAVSKEERVGLSPTPSDAERIRKFGSSRAARFAVEFVT